MVSWYYKKTIWYGKSIIISPEMYVLISHIQELCKPSIQKSLMTRMSECL